MKSLKDRIVYILQHNNVAADVAAVLANQQYVVRKFDSLTEMNRAISIYRPDVVLYDDNLPLSSDEVKQLTGLSVRVVCITDRLDVRSRVNAIRNGCVGIIEKPLAEADVLQVVEDNLLAVDKRLGRLLIIDDDIVFSQYLKTALETDDILVEILNEPLKSLKLLDVFDPEYIIIDINMPDVNGFELAGVIRQIQRYSHVPISFMSASDDPDIYDKAMRSGGEHFFSKTVDAEYIKSSIASRLSYARKLREMYFKLQESKLQNEQQKITLDKHAIVSIADIDGNITYVNDKFCEVSGYSRDELIGHNHRLVKSSFHDDAFYEDLWATISAGKIWQGEVCNLNKSGKEYWVESTIVPFLDRYGLPFQYVSIRTEITDLLRSQQRFELSQRFSSIGTWEWKISTGELYWSDEIAPLFGYRDKNTETTYENFLAAIHPDDRESVLHAIDQCVSHDKTYDIEHRVVWESGEVRWLRETGNVIRDANGKPVYMLGVVRDITVEKNLRQKLEASEKRMRSQLDSMSEGMFGLDENSCVTFVNQAASAMLGLGYEELKARQFSDVIVVTDETESSGWFLDNENASVMQEAYFRCVDGTVIPVEYSIMPMLTEEGVAGSVVTFKDITERKRAELELIEAKELAERANRAKSQFLSSMSHELRTPLNAIIGFGQLLGFDPGLTLNSLQRDNLNEILKASQHLLELINEVLDLAKIEAGQAQINIETINLNDVLSDCVSLISATADKKDIRLKYKQENEEVSSVDKVAGNLSVLADKLRLKQVFLNLLSNAIKYNREQGEVIISCSSHDNTTIKVNICDTGMGISEEQLENLFQPFNRLGHEASNVEGTGIGLVITKNLVDMMGGEISCSSKLGEGTKFTVELTMPDSSGEAQKQEAAQQRSFNILYIEDNPANIRMMAQLFSREPSYHLSTVHEPLLGLSMVEEAKPDLVLLDIDLPYMNGYQVLEKLHDLFGESYPVVAVSALSMKADIDKGMRAGFTDYITKPVDIQSFMSKVKNILEPGITNVIQSRL